LGTNKIRFTATSANGNNLYLDNITLQQGFIDTIFSYAPTSVNFMDTSVGQSCNKAFDAESEYGIANPIWVGISNSGTQTMIIPRENVYLTGVDFDQFWFQNSYFPRTIEAGSGFGLTIQFTPTSSGRKQAQLHIVYHGEDHIVTLSGFAHAETGEFWQRFEGTAFPPDMWSQIGQFEVDPSLGIFGGQSAFILINASEPEQMLITPVLELIGAINELSFVHVGLSNNLGFGSCTLQMKYQLWGTDSWTNLGNPIYYNHPEVVLKSINDLSGLPHGLYRFGFAVTSTFNYLDYTSAVVIDDVYGPNIYNNGVLAAPVVHLAAGRNLSWSTVINANQYQIYSSDRPDGTFSLLASTASNYWLDPDNTVNKRFYQVKAQGSVMRDSTRREQLREFLATQKSNILVWE
jgi:hypothetical protein